MVHEYLSEHEMVVKVSLLRNNANYGLGGLHKAAFQYAMDNDFDYVIFYGEARGKFPIYRYI